MNKKSAGSAKGKYRSRRPGDRVGGRNWARLTGWFAWIKFNPETCGKASKSGVKVKLLRGNLCYRTRRSWCDSVWLLSLRVAPSIASAPIVRCFEAGVVACRQAGRNGDIGTELILRKWRI